MTSIRIPFQMKSSSNSKLSAMAAVLQNQPAALRPSSPSADASSAETVYPPVVSAGAGSAAGSKDVLPHTIPYTSASRSAKAMQSINAFLEMDKIQNANEAWNRLNRTIRMRKLAEFANRYSSEHALSDEEKERMVQFFNQCLDQKKLQKVKEVIYDVESGVITSIPTFCYDRTTKHYTLKNLPAPAKRNTTKRASKPAATAAASSFATVAAESG